MLAGGVWVDHYVMIWQAANKRRNKEIIKIIIIMIIDTRGKRARDRSLYNNIIVVVMA